jgi:transcriptional regulator with XRE-family HTH domain
VTGEVFDGPKCRELRKALGWSVERLSSRIFAETGEDISPSAIRNYERGKTQPAIDTTSRIAHTLGVEFATLVRKETKP